MLLSYAEYRRLLGAKANIVERLAHPAAAEVAFEPPRALAGAVKPAQFD